MSQYLGPEIQFSETLSKLFACLRKTIQTDVEHTRDCLDGNFGNFDNFFDCTILLPVHNMAIKVKSDHNISFHATFGNMHSLPVIIL